MDCSFRRSHELKVPPPNGNIGSVNSLQWLLNAVNRLLKVNCPIRVVVGRYNYIDTSVSSKTASVAGTSQLNLNNLERDRVRSVLAKNLLPSNTIQEFNYFVIK